MSAFIVLPEQINSVLLLWNSLQYKPTPLSELADMAKTLYRENVRSVNYRYGEKNKTTLIVDLTKYQRIDLIQAIKYLDCLDYQSCERPDYKKSKAYHLINMIRSDLYSALFRQNQDYQNKYDLARWSL